MSMIILSHSNCPEGYVMVRKDRAGSLIGGGVAIICRNDWKVKALNVTDSSFDYLLNNLSLKLETMSLCGHDLV